MTNHRRSVVELIENLLMTKSGITEEDKKLIELIVTQIFDGIQQEIKQKDESNWGVNLG